MMNCKLVIFDLDGVILDSIMVIEHAYRMACQHVCGIDYPDFFEYRKHLGESLCVIANKLNLPESFCESFIQISNDCADEVKAYPGVSKLLVTLSDAGIRLGVATGKEGGRARFLLKKLDILHYFDLVLGSGDVVKSKPDPEMLLRHIREASCRNSEVLFVGDSVVDMQAATAAKVKMVAALWGYGIKEELLAYYPDYCCNSILEIMDVVDVR